VILLKVLKYPGQHAFSENIEIMGDAPILSEHVLVVFYRVMPPELKDVIRQKFSDAEVTIYQSQEGVPVPSGK
jgi:hypothetical protein